MSTGILLPKIVSYSHRICFTCSPRLEESLALPIDIFRMKCSMELRIARDSNRLKGYKPFI